MGVVGVVAPVLLMGFVVGSCGARHRRVRVVWIPVTAHWASWLAGRSVPPNDDPDTLWDEMLEWVREFENEVTSEKAFKFVDLA